MQKRQATPARRAASARLRRSRNNPARRLRRSAKRPGALNVPISHMRSSIALRIRRTGPVGAGNSGPGAPPSPRVRLSHAKGARCGHVTGQAKRAAPARRGGVRDGSPKGARLAQRGSTRSATARPVAQRRETPKAPVRRSATGASWQLEMLRRRSLTICCPSNDNQGDLQLGHSYRVCAKGRH